MCVALLILCVTLTAASALGHFHDRRAASTSKWYLCSCDLSLACPAVVPIQHEVDWLAKIWVCSHRVLSGYIKLFQDVGSRPRTQPIDSDEFG